MAKELDSILIKNPDVTIEICFLNTVWELRNRTKSKLLKVINLIFTIQKLEIAQFLIGKSWGNLRF